VRTVEEHDGPGVGGLEELGVRGRPDGVLRPSPAGGRLHMQPRPPPSSRGLWRLLPQEAVPSVERQGGRRVVPGGALSGGCHRRRLGCEALSLPKIYQTLWSFVETAERRVLVSTLHHKSLVHMLRRGSFKAPSSSEMFFSDELINC